MYLPPGTHLTACHENKSESLQFHIIAYPALLHRQKQIPSTPVTNQNPRNPASASGLFLKKNTLTSAQATTFREACWHSASWKMIYYLLLCFFKIVFLVSSGKEQLASSIRNESFQTAVENSSLTVNQQLELFVTVTAREAFQATRQKPGEQEQELVHLKGTIAT